MNAVAFAPALDPTPSRAAARTINLAPVLRASQLADRRYESISYPLGEIPRGALTEIAGPASSGRTSLLYSLLASATSAGEQCALLDAENRFDPESAADAGVRLSQLVWVRCGGNAEHALKSADMLANGGGFGLVAIDLADTPDAAVDRIPLAAWFRLRHAVEGSRTALVILERELHARSCSALKIELHRCKPVWLGKLPGGLLAGFDGLAETTRQHRTEERGFRVHR